MFIRKPTQIQFPRRVAGALVLAVLAGLSVPAAAQPAAAATQAAQGTQKKAVAIVLTQHKVVKDAQGREQLVDAGAVKPGDLVEYTATYTNNTGKPVTGLVADLPIPEGLEYLPRSAKPGAARVQAATRDAAFGPEPLMRKAAGDRLEAVPYADYRALRWNLGQLPANGSTAVSARARVETAAPPAVTAQAAPAPATSTPR